MIFKSRDMMKFFEKLVEAAQPFKDLAQGVQTLAEHTEKLAVNVAVLANNQAIMWQLITQLYNQQGSVDTKMPSLDADDKKEEKPN